MALQPEPTALGQLWDGGEYGAGGKTLAMGKLLEKQQKLLCKLSQTERNIAVSILGFLCCCSSSPCPNTAL